MKPVIGLGQEKWPRLGVRARQNGFTLLGSECTETQKSGPGGPLRKERADLGLSGVVAGETVRWNCVLGAEDSGGKSSLAHLRLFTF